MDPKIELRDRLLELLETDRAPTGADAVLIAEAWARRQEQERARAAYAAWLLGHREAWRTRGGWQ